jgi:hypothetical protein
MTVKEALGQLKEPYRSLALKNMNKGIDNHKANSIESALYMAFSWEKSPEKYQYWSEVHDRLSLKNVEEYEIY